MTYKILIVDDEVGMQTALKEVLLRSSYEVATASSGEEAKKILEAENFSAIITDVRMREMTGIELLEWINDKTPQVPVIIMTAYGTIEDAVDAMRKGARDYILKPFSPQAVRESLSRVLTETLNENTSGAKKKPSSKSDCESNFITSSPSMIYIKNFIGEIADSKATILIQGESGTGKEILSKYIHQKSNRRNGPFIAVNCAALPAGLLESELFGYEKGSFTGAIMNRKGKFELANSGTLLLDEISEMELALQAKLLRVLQEYEIYPLGSASPIKLDIRVIATTNKDITRLLAENKFREDLYYRLNVVTVELPPLRKRIEDIPPLCDYFLKKHCTRNNRPLKKLSTEALNKIITMEWKGNVRELENFIERAILLSKCEVIEINNLFLSQDIDNSTSNPVPVAGMTLEEMEKKLIINTLKMANYNRTKAANMLGVSVRTIRNKIHQYAITAAVE